MNYADPRPTAVFDTECFHGYWSIAFKCVDSGRSMMYERTPENELNRDGVRKIIKNWRLVSFNGNHYDIPMLCLALTGASNEELKKANDLFFLGEKEGKVTAWQFMERFSLTPPSVLDHIDLKEVAPGMASLKIYGGRVHTRKMQDLPFPPSHVMTLNADREIVRWYLVNDLDNTLDLYKALIKRIELRALMSDRYQVDMRSKSDAQLSEAVLRHDIEKLTKKRLYKPDKVQRQFRYTIPHFVKFESDELNEMLDRIERTEFFVNAKGSVDLPKDISDVTVAGDVYRMGIGGLHSFEKKRSFWADDEYTYIDVDVTSYYPNIIMSQGLHPEHIGPVFNSVFGNILDERVAAKRAGEKDKAEMLKITVNGCFGKLASKFSVVYSPKNMIQTTITGQLALLMLIERLSSYGFQVVSANTDGITTKVPRERRGDFVAVVADWEFDTEFRTESVEYQSVHQRDVNNYIAFISDTYYKAKGTFANEGLQKNPDKTIVTEAVIAFLGKGVPVEKTIRECRDIRKFLTIRTVNGGAECDGEFLGKAIRYYVSDWQPNALYYATNKNKVPRTEGARVMLELHPGHFPPDINYEHYIREAEAILQDVGVRERDPSIALMKGYVFARLPTQKNIHIVHVPTGKAICGKERASIRAQWVRFDYVGVGQRLCGHCKKENEL